MLEVGKKAPDFELPDQNGEMHKLSDYAGKKVILYFYPKDNTPGCTKQACGFSERYPQFTEKGAVILGVSKDSVASHKRFEEKYGLAFTLLADPERKVIEAYDVWKEKKNYGKVSMGVVRTTYLIDEQGIIIKAMIKSRRQMILKICLRNWHNEDYFITCKKMIVDTDNLAPVELPVYIDKTAEVLNWMKSKSKEELKAIWKCNDKIAEQNFNRLENMDLYNRLTPAVLAYEGIAFQYMAPSVFEIQQFEYLQNHLRILSAFYGILKPMDGVTPYRLEMQAKVGIGDAKNLYEYWGELLYRAVIDDSRIIINLASKEYSKCIEKYLTPQDRYITIVFCELSGDKLVTKGTYAKMARGEMVRFIAENNIENPVEIQKFDRLGYSFRSDLSSDSEYVFERKIK